MRLASDEAHAAARGTALHLLAQQTADEATLNLARCYVDARDDLEILLEEPVDAPGDHRPDWTELATIAAITVVVVALILS